MLVWHFTAHYVTDTLYQVTHGNKGCCLWFVAHRLYSKVNYVTRLEFLWDQVRRNEMEIPEFVSDHDEELEYHPMMDYGIESDHPRVYGAPPAMSVYSMRCIA